MADNEAELQLAVDILMEDWAMNPDKFELTVLRRGHQTEKHHVGCQEESTKVKLLGITVKK